MDLMAEDKKTSRNESSTVARDDIERIYPIVPIGRSRAKLISSWYSINAFLAGAKLSLEKTRAGSISLVMGEELLPLSAITILILNDTNILYDSFSRTPRISSSVR